MSSSWPFSAVSIINSSASLTEVYVQETKVSRQELTADIAIAEGYESFFSFTRAVKNGRIAYSGIF